jgi:OOP family OmpA-OmpF porin
MGSFKKFGFFLAALLACGVLQAQTAQAIRDQVFGATDAVKKQADDLNAQVLAPKSYEDGMELYLEANDGLEKGRDLERVRSNLTEAQQYFTRSIEAAKLAQTTFTSALAARAAAQKAEAAEFAERDWERAESALADAAETLEGGNLRKASGDANDIEEAYREAETKAIAAKTRAAR